MSDPYVAEIQIFPYSYAPRSWAWCHGQPMLIFQNYQLYSIIGKTFGFDNLKQAFNLPNLKARVPIGIGQAPGASNYALGQTGGADRVSLGRDELPSHRHEIRANRTLGDSDTPDANATVATYRKNRLYYRSPNTSQLSDMGEGSLADAGQSYPHENRQPYLALNFCISLLGAYPSPS